MLTTTMSKIMQPIDFFKPIEVVDFLGRADPAEYLRHQDMHPDRYEIKLHGIKYTVGADHRLLGPTDSNGQLVDQDLRVRNRAD